MSDLDPWLQALGQDADYTEAAAVRLDRRLAEQPSPRALARRQTWVASAAFAVVAACSGAVTGAFLEAQQAPVSGPLLPASQGGTAAALLFGQG